MEESLERRDGRWREKSATDWPLTTEIVMIMIELGMFAVHTRDISGPPARENLRFD